MFLISPFSAAGGGAPATITYTDSAEAGGSLATYSFASVDTGTAGLTRKTIIGVFARDDAGSFSVSGVTVDDGGGADAATAVISSDVSSPVHAAIYIIDNPTATTATIAVTFSEVVSQGCGIAVWAAYDLASSTATDTATAIAGGAASLDLSLDVSADGVAVAMSGVHGGADTATWTGLTERVEADIPTANCAYAAADGTTVGAPLSVTVDWTGAGNVVGVSASFR